MTLEECNLFFSLVIESSVDIAIPTKTANDVLCFQNNSQRAFVHMLARCRKVEYGMIKIINESNIKINDNHKRWTYKDKYELNNHTIKDNALVRSCSSLTIAESVDEKRHNL